MRMKNQIQIVKIIKLQEDVDYLLQDVVILYPDEPINMNNLNLIVEIINLDEDVVYLHQDVEIMYPDVLIYVDIINWQEDVVYLLLDVVTLNPDVLILDEEFYFNNGYYQLGRRSCLSTQGC
ncbi:MAG: hypothetical protein EZS28_049018 [Streblomastix strix]|uniref:Uncharacterized protein n=1 Tax=Streblomastix strix TaxID=222440 RepID=A0A5J4TDB6_9EUKA|nr:MAG: hypothetical protein EZS28_049018 [Streblomastix strix]